MFNIKKKEEDNRNKIQHLLANKSAQMLLHEPYKSILSMQVVTFCLQNSVKSIEFVPVSNLFPSQKSIKHRLEA